MQITSDWHIHSRNSCDGACMEIAELVRTARRLNIRDFGLTDHLHTPFNLPDIAASRKEYLANDPAPEFHFGIEVSCMAQAEIDEARKDGPFAKPPVYGFREKRTPTSPMAIGIASEDVARFKIEYVVGGTHWPMNVPWERDAVIRDYHRQNMFLATHPLVNIVAHPWWWMGHWKDADGNYPAEPWLDDFRRIPDSMHDEFAAAAREHRKVIEINLAAMLLTPHYPPQFKGQYLDYLAGLKARGTPLCIGSDCHSATYDQIDFERAAGMLASVGIADADLWRLPPNQ